MAGKRRETTTEQPKEMSQEETYKPMAVQPPTATDRIEALELQIELMKKALNYIYQQHYRKDGV